MPPNEVIAKNVAKDDDSRRNRNLICMFSITNYQKLDDLKFEIYHATVLKFSGPKWISLGEFQGVSKPVSLLEVLRENLFLRLFQFLEVLSVP